VTETSKKKAKSKRSPESAAPLSEPLPSKVPGTSSGAGIYVMGALLFAGAIALLLYMRCDRDPKPEPTAAVVPTATQAPVDAPKFAPPPPPEEEEDAGVEDAKTAEPTGEPKPKAAPGGGGGSCAKCGGEGATSSSALQSEVAKTGGLARGCYNRTLRAGAAEGSIMVSVSVGSDGNLCGARVTSDTVGNPALTQCVLSKFQSRSYPKPERGCVVINVPISFSMKK
jgi:outer membrane biosynthesis protein TonB